MDKKNPTDFVQSDPTKQPPPYSSSSSPDEDQGQSQSSDAQSDKKKQNSSSGRGGSGTNTNNNTTTTTNFVYFSDPTYNFSTANTTFAAAADGVNLSTAANVAYGNPSLTPVISVPPGLNTGMTSGTDALPSSNIFPVTQQYPQEEEEEEEEEVVVVVMLEMEETAAEIAEIATATATAVATVQATPVQTSATPSTAFVVSLATVATP
ncbi:hypothetical protein KI688_000913 [Linnemannia hyalina]|uniref:Uncharacterized protein n=1 Tax=Linnemannia hyalina TaxID=64524 RepID=A0A9P7Y7D8_9FUNG|nr:hypothetical protein KI688_000913 [Linnemannia hyalina]